ncbi:MAG: hypothetical protein OEY22_03040 [Candidatus Bathyarchaeota archaeon]|nr:hypothetical protein [Candidatus Bathyarchaeota archaeon]MDH5787538.1 hypothetical protein [Candidatus Bathyarchaeota archaeon]
MEIEYESSVKEGAEEPLGSSEILERWANACSDCNPLTPVTCMTKCDIWKSKNELRKLYEKMKNPAFMVNLLNTLKNKRRRQILKIISRGRYSTSRLQQELRKLGYYHSQKTITEEYVYPLVDVGLVDESQNKYYATAFGRKLGAMIETIHNLENILPPHSECYEEIMLYTLQSEPKTFEDLKGIIQTKSVSRVLSRLQRAGLIETTKEKDYVFYFRTKRDPKKAKFSPTERKVYENISLEGVSARKLSENAKISLRRTYKYLRKLKGKKLVFARKSPKLYTLTTKGIELSVALLRIRRLVSETLRTALELVGDTEAQEALISGTSQVIHIRKEKEAVPVTIVERF